MKERQEISLFDIGQVLVRQKKIIALIWLGSLLLAVVYVMVSTPVYKSEVFMLPPSQQDIEPLNLKVLLDFNRLQSLGDYNREDVYQLFVQALKSRSVRRAFYEKHGVAEKLGYTDGVDPNVFFEVTFNKKLVLSQKNSKKGEESFVSLSLIANDAGLAAQLVNAFVQETSNALRVQLASSVEAKVNTLKAEALALINAKKSLAGVNRADRIAALKEALKLSEHVGGDKRKELTQVDRVAVNTNTYPLYFYSPAMLKAEIKVLESRENDAPFIDGLRKLEEKIAVFESIAVDKESIQVVNVDQKAFVAKVPVGVGKFSILLMASLSGILLGSIVALLRRQSK